MPVKWSALKVNDAMDMVAEFVGQAVEPMDGPASHPACHRASSRFLEVLG